MSDRPVKMVIVIRKDLKMRRGKEIAQGAHAAQAWIMERILERLPDQVNVKVTFQPAVANLPIRVQEAEWIRSNFRKVTLQVDSEAELLETLSRAKQANLEAHIIKDAGLTEFDGKPTYTAVAIGPDYDEKIDPITSHLKLY